jgi:hypothetical protein
VGVRNEGADSINTNQDAIEWIVKASDWRERVFCEIKRLDENAAEDYELLDIVPPPRNQPSNEVRRSSTDGNRLPPRPKLTRKIPIVGRAAFEMTSDSFAMRGPSHPAADDMILSPQQSGWVAVSPWLAWDTGEPENVAPSVLGGRRHAGATIVLRGRWRSSTSAPRMAGTSLAMPSSGIRGRSCGAGSPERARAGSGIPEGASTLLRSSTTRVRSSTSSGMRAPSSAACSPGDDGATRQ